MNEITPPVPRAVLVGVQLPGVDDVSFADSLRELGQLAKTLGLEVAGQITQRREALDPAAGLGPGKIPELKALIGEEPERPTVVVVDHELSPSQARNLEKASGAEVMDRTQIILEIFHRHARSREARAQVEIVRLSYTAPRLREKGRGVDRVRGGIGGKGAGESGLELDRRKIRDRIAELRREISRIEEERRTQRARRQGLPRVALVGYTNAGKSTLMRALTGSEVYTADKLFATLDTTVRALSPASHPRILISDTVGFIKKLPHDLVASFRSTLDEVLEASLVAHIVDASDPALESQIATTLEVLRDIGGGEVPRLLVFNKIDRVPPEALDALLLRYPDALAISAKHPEDVARLRQALIDHFVKDHIEADLVLPYDRQQLRGELFEVCEVLEETYDERGACLRVRAAPEDVARLQRQLCQDAG